MEKEFVIRLTILFESVFVKCGIFEVEQHCGNVWSKFLDIFPQTDKVRKMPEKLIDMFPRTDGRFDIHTINSLHVETVVLICKTVTRSKSHVDLSLDVEDYNKIKDAEKEQTK